MSIIPVSYHKMFQFLSCNHMAKKKAAQHSHIQFKSNLCQLIITLFCLIYLQSMRFIAFTFLSTPISFVVLICPDLASIHQHSRALLFVWMEMHLFVDTDFTPKKFSFALFLVEFRWCCISCLILKCANYLN